MRLFKTSTLVYAHPSSVTESGTGASVQALNVDRVDIGDGERATLKDFRTGQIATGTNAPSPRRSGESGEFFGEPSWKMLGAKGGAPAVEPCVYSRRTNEWDGSLPSSKWQVEPATINRFHLAAALFGAFAVWVLSMMATTAIGDGRRIEGVERGDEIRGGEVWR